MDITIIIDKSTFQSLSFDELYRLTSYYKHVITPVLVMEILGDLKKEFDDGKKPSSERVKDFANKLFPVETIVNLHYKILLKGDLLGNGPSMDGRPNVGMHKAVQSDSGQKGYIVQESEEEKSIYKWKDGNFSEADHELSFLWRVQTTQENLLTRLKQSLTIDSSLKLSDFNELDTHVMKVLNAVEKQQVLLFALMQNYDIDPGTALLILKRWKLEGSPMLQKFAPFAFHCLKVDLLFLFGLASGLISTRPTNRVDLEYLYYLPFCNVFTSNDKVHKNLTPLLLSSYQQFITGADLKQDLKQIVEHLEGFDETTRKKFKNRPPLIPTSITFQLWKSYFDYPHKYANPEVLEGAEKEKVLAKMKEFERALDADEIDFAGGNDAEFFLKKSYLGKNDLCFCGSGKKVVDCCIPEQQFDELAKKEWLKQQAKYREKNSDNDPELAK